MSDKERESRTFGDLKMDVFLVRLRLSINGPLYLSRITVLLWWVSFGKGRSDQVPERKARLCCNKDSQRCPKSRSIAVILRLDDCIVSRGWRGFPTNDARGTTDQVLVQCLVLFRAERVAERITEDRVYVGGYW